MISKVSVGLFDRSLYLVFHFHFRYILSHAVDGRLCKIVRLTKLLEVLKEGVLHEVGRKALLRWRYQRHHNPHFSLSHYAHSSTRQVIASVRRVIVHSAMGLSHCHTHDDFRTG